MKIAITGSTGFVGSALTKYLQDQGHTVLPFSRKKSSSYFWDPENKIISTEHLEGLDALIHLAGENIAKHYWTKSFKEKLWKSRVDSTTFLVSSIKTLQNPPKIFLSASAVGIYGEQNDTIVNEATPAGTGFLCRLCKAWEEATTPLNGTRTRIIHFRFGAILCKQGGVLRKLVSLFNLRLGGKVGSGKQYMSWVSLEDVIQSIDFTLHTTSIRGALNCTSPFPVTNEEFTKTLGAALKRPTFFTLPAFIIRLLFGEMGEAILLCSTRCYPKVLLENGYTFSHLKLSDLFL